MPSWRENYHELSLSGIETGLSLDLVRIEPDLDAEKLVHESGLYVGCLDFMDVCRASRRAATARDFPRRFHNEATINLFHTLVLYLCPSDFFEPVKRELRYNPANHSSSDKHANSYRYFMLAEALRPLSRTNVSEDCKVEGIGFVGRQMMRFVLFDTDEL